MEEKLKISIITVSYNAVKTIEETICSVINQTYTNIEYIIIDGGSTDGTVDIIKKYEDKLAYWVSEPDRGMYDALVKGMKHVTGAVCAYINADDFYQIHAFDIVNDIFQNPARMWITGIAMMYNNRSQIVGARLPYRYRRRFIQKGLYNGRYLPWIQQESTFWRVDLLDQIDFTTLAHLKYTGDFYMWQCFSHMAELDIVEAGLSGFRRIEGQLSENLTEYNFEMKALVEQNVNIFDIPLIVLDRISGGYPIRLNKKIIKYNHKLGKWD